MNDFSRHIPAAAADTALTPAERERMRRAVYGYMALKPLERQARGRSARGWHALFSHPALAALGVLAIIGSSTGISYAAESALPGDLLYPVKVGVTEPLRGALATTPQAKTEWAISVASARATEAATLAAAGTLDQATESALSESLVAHARIASESLSEASSTDSGLSAERAARFEARLVEYERVLVALSAERGERPAIAAALEDARASVSRVHDDDEGDAAHLAVAARESLAASNRLALSSQHAFSSTTARSISERIESASGTVALAGSDDRSPGSRSALRKAIADTEKMNAYVETSASIHKRTGLVIAGRAAEDTSRHGGDAQRMAKAESAPAPATLSLMMTAPVGDTATTASSTASSTEERGDESGKKGGDDHEKRHSDEEHDDDRPELTIPLPDL